MVGLISAIICCGVLFKSGKRGLNFLDLDARTKLLLLSLRQPNDDTQLEPYQRRPD